MNKKDTDTYQDGQSAAAQGAGLSDDPYGGHDGFVWRRGVSDWINDHEAHETSTAGKSNGNEA